MSALLNTPAATVYATVVAFRRRLSTAIQSAPRSRAPTRPRSVRWLRAALIPGGPQGVGVAARVPGASTHQNLGRLSAWCAGIALAGPGGLWEARRGPGERRPSATTGRYFLDRGGEWPVAVWTCGCGSASETMSELAFRLLINR